MDRREHFSDEHRKWFSREAQLFQTIGAGTLGALGAFIGLEIVKQFGIDAPHGPELGMFIVAALSKYHYLDNSERR